MIATYQSSQISAIVTAFLATACFASSSPRSNPGDHGTPSQPENTAATSATSTLQTEPGHAQEHSPGTLRRLEGCVQMLAAVEAAETEVSDALLSKAFREGASMALHARLKEHGNRIAGTSHHASSAQRRAAVQFSGHATMVLASALLVAATVNQNDRALGNSNEAVAIALELAMRQRRFAYFGVRTWCSSSTPREQSAEWVRGVEEVLAAIQGELVKCARAANSRLALDDTHFTVAWRAVVETSGQVSIAAPVDFPSNARADIVLCILEHIEQRRFPPPSERFVIGANQSFKKGAD